MTKTTTTEIDFQSKRFSQECRRYTGTLSMLETKLATIKAAAKRLAETSGGQS